MYWFMREAVNEDRRVSLVADPLSNLFGSERADTIQSKRKDNAILVAQAHVESEVLRRNHATFPGIANRDRRADERAVAAGERMLLKIEE